jgi:hypothetical protein
VRAQAARIRELIAMLDELPLDTVEPAAIYDIERGVPRAGGGDG